jgi:spore coat protein U-like protein
MTIDRTQFDIISGNSSQILTKSLIYLITIATLLIPAAMTQACVDYYVQAPNFNYQPQLLSPTIGITTINITKFTCRQPVYLRLTAGKSLTYQKRYMNNGTNRLQYNFYVRPTANSSIWGDGSGGTYIQQISGTTSVSLYTIIDPQQDIVPGSYADAINFSFAP